MLSLFMSPEFDFQTATSKDLAKLQDYKIAFTKSNFWDSVWVN